MNERCGVYNLWHVTMVAMVTNRFHKFSHHSQSSCLIHANAIENLTHGCCLAVARELHNMVHMLEKPRDLKECDKMAYMIRSPNGDPSHYCHDSTP